MTFVHFSSILKTKEMKISIKERAGILDTSKIFEGLHLTEGFIRNSALNPDAIEPEFKKSGDHHFGICDKCSKKKESFLPLAG